MTDLERVDAAELIIRAREDADVDLLAAILERQQPMTRYPFFWPPRSGARSFIQRQNEMASWVAILDAEVVGHVAITGVADDDLGRLWSAAHQVPVDRLRCISVLFADIRHGRRGIGSRLLTTATDAALAMGGAPVLDVVAGHEAPMRLYQANGWQIVGRHRPVWLPETEEPIYVMIRPLDEVART